ncbi:MAG: hypothetical protein M0T70_14245 [Geobacteraceae bacterium]|nr:hypothetical protein [Geobacteraceae bacterium]
MLVSKRKRYLSGSDWVLNTLDYMMKAVTSSGNVCQIVLTLKSPLSEQQLRTALNRFVRQFPVLQGKVARDFKLTPYWKIPATMERDVRLDVSNIRENSPPEFLFSELVRHANSPFPDGDEYIDFHLFTSGGRCVLAMRFDHRLFDARGAESFLNLFQSSLDDSSLSGDMAFTSSAELTEWKSKFLAGKNVNRAIIALSKSIPRTLPIQPAPDKGYRYRLLTFSRQETAAIYEKAYRDAGYLMESSFFLAVITQAMHELCASRPGTGSCYLIPVTMDLRPGKEPLQEVFFNHVSYLFYQIPVELAADLKGLAALFKQQMYDQVKSGFPRDLAAASLLTRIVPRGLFGKLMSFPMNGKIATFAYSHLGKSSYQSQEFMDSPIENIFHMPRVPVPPGLGFFSSQYDGRLNLVISYLDGIMTDEELEGLDVGIRRKFGGGPK